MVVASFSVCSKNNELRSGERACQDKMINDALLSLVNCLTS